MKMNKLCDLRSLRRAPILLGMETTPEQLLALVYDELRRLAAAYLANEKPGQTLQPTALVHEAYLRLMGSAGCLSKDGSAARAEQESGRAGETENSSASPAACPPGATGPPFNSRTRFFAAAAEAMRRILVDRARRKAAIKHGGKFVARELSESDLATTAPPEEVIAVHEALDQLAAEDPLTAELIKLRYFGGFTIEEASEKLGMSISTANRLWTYGKAWLRDAISGEDD